MPSFPRATFNKVAKARCEAPLKRDESDVLMYLIYMDYLNKLVHESQVQAGAADLRLFIYKHMYRVKRPYWDFSKCRSWKWHCEGPFYYRRKVLAIEQY